MKLRNALSLFSITVLGLGLLAGQAVAGTKFANFDDPNQTVVFTNNGANSTFTSSPIAVNFYYNTANGLEAIQPSGETNAIAAYLTITQDVVQSSASQVTLPGIGADDVQPFTSLTLSFTDVANGANLLTVTDTSTANMIFPTSLGGDGGGNATIAPTSQGSGATDVTYTSAYLNFTNVSEENYNFNLLTIIDTGADSGDAGPTIATNGYLESFNTTANGQFASTPVPVAYLAPEPSSALAIGIASAGLLSLLLYGTRRKHSNGALNL